MERINEVTELIAQGACTCRVCFNNEELERFIIDKIIQETRFINEYPYDHFCIYDTGGVLRVTINCLAPCEVEYIE